MLARRVSGQTETGVKYVLASCPFDDTHKDAAVFDYPSGPVFSCFHDSCKENNWHTLSNNFDYQPLILSANGEPKAVLANAVHMFEHAPEWQGVLGFNEFSLYAVTKLPAPWQSVAGRNWLDDDDTRAACWLQHQGILVGSKVAAEAVQTVARKNSFHPVREYLAGLVWDQKPRLLDWMSSNMGAEASPLTSAIGLRWMISAVARIMKPGCKADYTLLLEGKQGKGKSTAMQILTTSEWFTDHLSDMSGKDAQIELHGKWVIELGEFVNKRSELERKAFLTKTHDYFRPPYERRAQQIPRSNVFCASTNNPVPLTDSTGGRRYWCVTCCGQIDFSALERDRDQLWAEAYALYQAGESWWDDFKEFREALAAEQESRYRGGPNDETILGWCAQPKRREEWQGSIKAAVEPFDSSVGRVTLADILRHGLGASLPFKYSDWHPLIDCLEHAGWRREKKQTKIPGTNRVVSFYVAPLSTEEVRKIENDGAVEALKRDQQRAAMSPDPAPPGKATFVFHRAGSPVKFEDLRRKS
jgi:hypothetical protein